MRQPVENFGQRPAPPARPEPPRETHEEARHRTRREKRRTWKRPEEQEQAGPDPRQLVIPGAEP